MADVLIHGMKMPRRREEVFLFAVDSDGKVYGWNSEEFPSLKAIAVPDHGRLIDADALMLDVRKHSESYFADDFAHEWVDKAPTIIPASTDGE